MQLFLSDPEPLVCIFFPPLNLIWDKEGKPY